MTQMIDKQHFTTTILVDQTPGEVFHAVNNVREWWTGGEIEGSTDKLHDEFVYKVKDVHYSKMKVIEFVPNRKVVWLVTDASLNFVKDTGEWTGTKVCFDISQEGDKTRLVFTHEGLVPAFECYDACSPAWTYYVRESLLRLITTGKGHANEEVSQTA